MLITNSNLKRKTTLGEQDFVLNFSGSSLTYLQYLVSLFLDVLLDLSHHNKMEQHKNTLRQDSGYNLLFFF